MNDSREFQIVETMLSSDEQKWRAEVRKWAEESARPLANDAYANGVFPKELAAQLGQRKWLGVVIPGDNGCAGKSYREYGILCQETESADSGLRSFISVQSSLAMHAIYQFGSEAHKNMLPEMASGKILGCFSLTEPQAGSDPSAMNTRAEKTSAGWRLHGHKRWVTSASIADIAVVWAQTDNGIRGFVVPLDAPGVKVPPLTDKLSLRMSASAEIVLDNCELGEDAMLPGTEAGLKAALSCLTQARFGICWGAIGLAARCYQLAKARVSERKQFNRPLAGFQLVQEKLADIYADIVRGQLLNLRLADMMENGECKPAHISLGKREACRTARKAARDCRDLFGGDGILLSAEVMRHMTNMETVYTYEGTDHVHTLVLGQYVTGENAFV